MSFQSNFAEPPREYTLIPFWFLNDELDEAELKRQIDDFAAHGVYGFLPHARIGLAESIDYMSERWLHFVGVCVDYAATKNMTVVLYDEGMYPSGSCCGQVVAANARHATRCLERRPREAELTDDEERVGEDDRFVYVNARSGGHIRGVHYGQDDGEPGAPPSADILNPEATASFFRLALDPYYETMREHFGKTIIAVFTDEPDVLGRGHKRDVLAWTWGFERWLQEYLGYDLRPYFGALFDAEHPDHAHYTGEWRRAVNAKLEEAYYAPYSTWCAEHGVALTGHPAQPGELGVEKYFHIPGQDIVWRYIEPYKDNAIEGPQSTMAKCSASAQRHHGRSRNMNECFGAYGWDFTEDEMWWVTNWLLVRGVNMLIPHAFYYSIRDARRDERPPDVGPNNVWWDRFLTYADYCRRMCWLISQGRQVCSIALLGSPTDLPWRAARVLFETQRDFNYLDTDTLKTQCTVGSDGIEIRGMTYRVLIVDGSGYANPDVLRVLRPMIDAGHVVPYIDPVAGIPALAASATELSAFIGQRVPDDVVIDPPAPQLRMTHYDQGDAHVYVFANEGREDVRGTIAVSAPGTREWWDPETGAPIADQPAEAIHVPPYRLRVLRCSGA